MAFEFDPRWRWPTAAAAGATLLAILLGSAVDARAKGDRAATSSDGEESESPAQVLFEAGREAMKRGEYELACKKFRESYSFEPAIGTLLNLGNCEERQGRLTTAFRLYDEAAQKLDADDPRADFARRRADELTRKIPTLVVSLSPSAPEEIRVTRNGQLLTTEFGSPVQLDPGRVVVVAEASGYHPRVYQLDLAAGEKERLSVGVGARIAPNRAAEAAPAKAGSDPTLGYVFLATGGASTIAAATFGFLTYSEYRTVRDNCDVEREECFNATGREAAQTGATYETLAYVFGGVGIVGLSLGGYFLLSEADPGSADGQATLSVGAVGADSPGLLLRGNF